MWTLSSKFCCCGCSTHFLLSSRCLFLSRLSFFAFSFEHAFVDLIRIFFCLPPSLRSFRPFLSPARSVGWWGVCFCWSAWFFLGLFTLLTALRLAWISEGASPLQYRLESAGLVWTLSRLCRFLTTTEGAAPLIRCRGCCWRVIAYMFYINIIYSYCEFIHIWFGYQLYS